MERLTVASSTIRSIGYDPFSSTLEIEFTNGHVYQYLGVPEGVHSSLVHSPSKGAYFNHRIKERFEFRRVE